MLRRTFLAAATAPLLSAVEPARSHLFFSDTEAPRLRELGRTVLRARLENQVAAALKNGPWSVTFKRPEGLNVAAGPNDYVSEAPYWFPDPTNPNGPYIRRDGVRNDARFNANVGDMRAMSSATLALGLGSFCLGTPGAADHASTILKTWFIDPRTRMNPNLEFGQMVRGHNTGRGTGIIDTDTLIHCAQGVVLLELAGGFPADVAAGVRSWYSDYSHWLTTSQKGKEERDSGNNHATWWTAQLAAYASFTGNTAHREQAWQAYRRDLVPSQIRPNGSCPREEARTRSLHYSSMNLDAFSLICRLAQLDGVDLWNFRTKSGTGIATAVNYLLPYTLEPATWKHQEIGKYDAGSHYFVGLAGSALHDEKMLAAYQAIPRDNSLWGQFLDLVVRASAPV